MRRALPTTAAIVALEALVVLFVAPTIAAILAERTGAVLDAARIIPGWVERTADAGVRDSLARIALPLVGLGAFVVVEPFLAVLFVRAHEVQAARGPLRLLARVARTIAVRSIATFAIGVFCALAGAAAFAAYVGLDRLTDPRPRDLVQVLFGVLAGVLVLRVYVLSEVATVRAAIRDESAFESLVRSYSVARTRLVVQRTACFVASAGVSLATAFVPTESWLALPIAFAAISVRALIRSAYIAHVIGETNAESPASVPAESRTNEAFEALPPRTARLDSPL